MQQGEQQIPEEIFSWLQNSDFNDLTHLQQQLVSQFFTVLDYQDIRLAMNEVKTLKINQQKERERKNKVLQAFDEFHTISKVTHQNHSFFWKIAASVVSVAFISLFVMWFKSGSVAPARMAALTDTVYITKKVPGETLVLHDTVYSKIKVYESFQQNVHQDRDEKTVPLNETALQELTTLPVADALNSENSFKGNSMQEDSLWMKFSPVSL